MFEKIKKLFESDSEPSTSEAQPSTSELNEFTDLTSRLIDLMGEFALLTLRTISNRKGALLNKTQIEETVDFDLQFRIQQIQDPEILDIVRERVISEYIEEQKTVSQN